MNSENKEKELENAELEVSDNVTDEPSTNENGDSKATNTDNTETSTDNLALEKERFLRLYSEFENYKRRTAKERLDLMMTASKDLILQLLPVIDDLERAFKMLDGQSEEVKKELEGFKLIHKKLYSTLENKGLKPIVAIGNIFDVELHEAITKIPAPSEDLKGKVLDEVEKGYTLNEHVIRYSKVVIGE